MSENTPAYDVVTNSAGDTDAGEKAAISEMKRQIEVLNYQVEALQDMTRINVSAAVLAGLVTRNGRFSGSMIKSAYEAADALVTHQVDTIQEKAFAFQEKLAKAEAEAALDRANAKLAAS